MIIKHADRRAVAMGAKDVPANNIDPTYRGSIVINGVKCEVINSGVFNGTLHFGILTLEGEKSMLGWVPAFLCDII